jgi:MipA family protein
MPAWPPGPANKSAPKGVSMPGSSGWKLAFLLAVVLAFVPAARADRSPLWEAGAGIAGISLPDYRGSDETRVHVLPVPYVVYRGEFLQVDREKVRGLFVRRERWESDVSFGATVPVKSEDNAARRGMPDLDATLEVGPSLNFFLRHSGDGKFKLDLRLPLRAVNATDLHKMRQVGWIVQPNLNLDVHDLFGHRGWNLGILGGPVFADRRYHRYVYGVEPPFATPGRPAYDARSGFGGTQFIAAISKRFPRFWLGGFVKYDNLSGAVFADSPLVKRKQNVSAGLALSYVFSQSDIRVEASD